MGSGGGSSGGGDTQTTVRYAPYLETMHSRYLDHEGADEPTSSFTDVFNATLGLSPYGDYAPVDIPSELFGFDYRLVDFPSLWDMFGKFMAGLDLHALWGQIYTDVIDGAEIQNVISAQSALLQDDIDTVVLPKFLAGMRDINSVQSTTFVMGKAIIQDAHVKSINKFASQIRLHALNISNEQFAKHLDWNTNVIKVYSDMYKLYYASKLDLDRAGLEYEAKDAMWDINLFENARGIINAMSGAAATASQNEPSQGSSALGGAMSGASAGFMASGGSPAGAVVGGVLGLAASFF